MPKEGIVNVTLTRHQLEMLAASHIQDKAKKQIITKAGIYSAHIQNMYWKDGDLCAVVRVVPNKS